MVPTRWCGAHYCTASDQCDEKRAEGSDKFCRDHICQEPGCHGGKVSDGYFCIEHTCKTEGCRVRSEREAQHCGSHLCRVEDCVRPAVANRRCDHHRRCAVESCREWVYIEHGPEGEIRWPECENRESPSQRSHHLHHPLSKTPNQLTRSQPKTTVPAVQPSPSPIRPATNASSSRPTHPPAPRPPATAQTTRAPFAHAPMHGRSSPSNSATRTSAALPHARTKSSTPCRWDSATRRYSRRACCSSLPPLAVARCGGSAANFARRTRVWGTEASVAPR